VKSEPGGGRFDAAQDRAAPQAGGAVAGAQRIAAGEGSRAVPICAHAMTLQNQTHHSPKNIEALRLVIESFSTKAVVLPEEFGDADLLVVKCQTHPSFGAIIMGLPRKWLENPDLEAKVTLAAQHFGSCVEISISEQARLGIPPIRKVETKKAG
jgi:hypothetical protein